ncbi:HAD-IA family hydrolase [Endozoicomonas arenosclerae]|uniref:HAD-IA family hydrolase n=1 Tax=Endozoicomonas arenosclerae TaxID=1633495 RepID=UPI000785852F|nr:HAD-IA family hydrolase [Endozoicomonas arenosclerae]
MFTKNYEKIIFDMDGTLVDSTEVVEKAWRVWANNNDVEAAGILAVAHGRPAEDVIREVKPQLDIDKEVADLEAFELQNADSVKPIPGSIEFLSQINKDDWAIFTSASRELALRRLKAASIPIPKILITVEDVTYGKPNPEGYIMAAEKLGVTTEECLVFEDAEAGVYSALEAGCDVIKINTATPHRIEIDGSVSVEDYFDVSVCLKNQWISISSQQS